MPGVWRVGMTAGRVNASDIHCGSNLPTLKVHTYSKSAIVNILQRLRVKLSDYLSNTLQ